MTFRKLLSILTFIAVAAMALRVSVASDTFWHLRAGEWILDHGQILRTDPFSLTRSGEAWVYPGWLAQVVMSLVYRAAGFPGLNIFTTACVLLGFYFIWKTLEGDDFIRVVVLLLAAVTSAVYWSARPHILTFALTGYFVWVLESSRKGNRKYLWTLPLAMVLWGNFHGGFASGFILILCYLLGELLETLLPVLSGSISLSVSIERHSKNINAYALSGLMCVLGLSVNPHGPRMVLYPFMTVEIEALREHIQEWQSPNFHDVQVYPFMTSIVLMFAALATSVRRSSAHELVLSSIYLILALTAARNIALFALVSAPVLARHLSSALEPLTDRLHSGNELDPRVTAWLNPTIILLCALAAGLKASIPLRPTVNDEAIRDMFPASAIEFIRGAQPDGPMFNSYNWGAYILWELYPEYPSFVDGRTDLFNDEILSKYLAAWRGEEGWEELFAKWGIRLAFIEPDAPLRFRLTQAGWETLFEDEQSMVLVSPDGPDTAAP